MSSIELYEGFTAKVDTEDVLGRVIPSITLTLDGTELGFNPVCDVRQVSDSPREFLISKQAGDSVYVNRFILADDGLAQKYIPNSISNKYAQTLDELEAISLSPTNELFDRSVYIPERHTIARHTFRWDHLDELDSRDDSRVTPTPTQDTARYIEPKDSERCKGCGQTAQFVETRSIVERTLWFGIAMNQNESTYECCERCAKDDLFENQELYEEFRSQYGYYPESESEREEADMHALRVDEIDDHLEAAMTDSGQLERTLIFGTGETDGLADNSNASEELTESEFATVFG